MSSNDFQTYYTTPTKLVKNALNIAEQLFCHPRCNNECQTPCNRHTLPCTLKTRYITNNQTLTPTFENPLDTPLPQQTQPTPPPNITNNPMKFPIHTILNHKSIETKNKYKITIKYNTYLCQWLCQWILQDNLIYHKWMPQRTLFPLNQPLAITHNINILREYYTRHQHKYYKNMVNSHFIPKQTRDTRFIPPSTKIPHTQISIIECNPEKDIATEKHTIQTQDETTHIYDDTGKYLITIPTTRLK